MPGSADVIDDPTILYVLMRTDLPDYQPGKSMAQANHAGTRFMRDMVKLISATYGKETSEHETFIVDYYEWLAEADGFGTCVVLGVSRYELHQRLRAAAFNARVGVASGLVHDPTYPIRDGDRIQTLPVDTCGYVFGRKSHCVAATHGLNLFAG